MVLVSDKITHAKEGGRSTSESTRWKHDKAPGPGRRGGNTLEKGHDLRSLITGGRRAAQSGQITKRVIGGNNKGGGGGRRGVNVDLRERLIRHVNDYITREDEGKEEEDEEEAPPPYFEHDDRLGGPTGENLKWTRRPLEGKTRVSRDTQPDREKRAGAIVRGRGTNAFEPASSASRRPINDRTKRSVTNGGASHVVRVTRKESGKGEKWNHDRYEATNE
eukprot:Ihof_evm2s469 gene=Ihof_evmTU2s469